ncbi:unnamed protein product [Musa hybrid cultivar]
MSYLMACYVCQVTYVACHSVDVGNHYSPPYELDPTLLVILILLPLFRTLRHPHPLALTSPPSSP